ncbi:MAG TPA: hypothetical protein VHE13_02020 [Opitutus sp.]|nr:hypothetical protein [Opitutus sp.]
MKTPAKTLTLLAATCLAFASTALAQLQTYQTLLPDAGPPVVVGYSGSVDTFNGTNRFTQGEVFSNVLAIDSMTYNLFTTGAPAASQLTATFGQWNTSTNSFVGTTISFGTINVPSAGSWSSFDINTKTYALTFDITAANASTLYTTNPNLSYALMISQVSPGNLGYGIGKADQDTDFAYGYGLILNSSGGLNSNIGTDFVFSQIVVEPNPTIPESSTVASILAVFFVAGLVGFRLRQRRLQQQLATVPVLTA